MAGLTITRSAPSGDVQRHLAGRLPPVGRVLLVGAPVALQRRVDRLPERAVERGRVLGGVGEHRGVGVPGRRPGRRGRRRPGRPSSRRCRPCRRRTRPAPRPSRGTAAGWRRCRRCRRRSSTPQCPWSVNSSRHRSAISTVSSPTSARRSDIATLSMPSGSVAGEPTASRTVGDPEHHQPTHPGRDRLRGRLAERVPGVLQHSRHRATAAPARSATRLTNSGSTRSAGCSRVSATSRRIGAVRRSRRGRTVGYIRPPAWCGHTK